jgi:hypothetical protein
MTRNTPPFQIVIIIVPIFFRLDFVYIGVNSRYAGRSRHFQAETQGEGKKDE